MKFEKTYIPYGLYWSSPFCRWQGSFAHLHSLVLAADCCQQALSKLNVPVEILDGLVLGLTVPQKGSFYGAPWLAGLIGNPTLTGPTISQACATSARCVATASSQIELGSHKAVLAVATDKTSNGPHIYYPNPKGIGGKGDPEDWVWDNFNFDPYAQNTMIATAENVARETGITRAEQDEVALLRSEQYQAALKDESAFLKRYMLLPYEVKDPSGRKIMATLSGDEGIFPTTPEGLAKLKPVLKDGTVTFGSQTHPADGNASLILTDKESALELSRDKNVEIKVVTYAEARTKKGYMAMSVVPAAQKALTSLGMDIKQLKAIKTHNPFAVNDVYFCREMGIQPQQMNNYGSSLVWGHPQGPTGLRLIIELIEELVLLGGGYGMFDGCAAGDTAAAVIIKVDLN